MCGMNSNNLELMTLWEIYRFLPFREKKDDGLVRLPNRRCTCWAGESGLSLFLLQCHLHPSGLVSDFAFSAGPFFFFLNITSLPDRQTWTFSFCRLGSSFPSLDFLAWWRRRALRLKALISSWVLREEKRTVKSGSLYVNSKKKNVLLCTWFSSCRRTGFITAAPELKSWTPCWETYTVTSEVS